MFKQIYSFYCYTYSRYVCFHLALKLIISYIILICFDIKEGRKLNGN